MAESLSGDLRELRLLEVLEAEPEARQADLAERLGVAVGTVNWLLKRLAAKGYVKIQRISRWHWRYLLTPQGVREKSRLLTQYIRDSLSLYRQVREEARRLLGQLKSAGYSRVELRGEGEIADIVRLTSLEQEIEPVEAFGSSSLPVIRIEGYRLELFWPGETLLPGAKEEAGGTPA